MLSKSLAVSFLALLIFSLLAACYELVKRLARLFSVYVTPIFRVVFLADDGRSFSVQWARLLNITICFVKIGSAWILVMACMFMMMAGVFGPMILIVIKAVTWLKTGVWFSTPNGLIWALVGGTAPKLEWVGLGEIRDWLLLWPFELTLPFLFPFGVVCAELSAPLRNRSNLWGECLEPFLAPKSNNRVT
jgi:hypothetical protein